MQQSLQTPPGTLYQTSKGDLTAKQASASCATAKTSQPQGQHRQTKCSLNLGDRLGEERKASRFGTQSCSLKVLE
ncbi:hypothetical protein B0T16DRAFT_398658 [Cercophora newfieldiana]|uniref:Uncharacterized protein n=1 Tax=Cercophora newfieldiana TaxID=92897 RepID=A0AA39YQP3_9PEZI|nr:hypothetical protein B0T16DRAFT_398658 [Cercophora newfieldiana]